MGLVDLRKQRQCLPVMCCAAEQGLALALVLQASHHRQLDATHALLSAECKIICNLDSTPRLTPRATAGSMLTFMPVLISSFNQAVGSDCYWLANIGMARCKFAYHVMPNTPLGVTKHVHSILAAAKHPGWPGY
jgi:hypothetical protein